MSASDLAVIIIIWSVIGLPVWLSICDLYRYASTWKLWIVSLFCGPVALIFASIAWFLED